MSDRSRVTIEEAYVRHNVDLKVHAAAELTRMIPSRLESQEQPPKKKVRMTQARPASE